MATIQKRTTGEGKTRYRVLVRLKGFPTECATFGRKTDAKRWAEQTESAILEGHHFRTSQARKHTLTDLVDRYFAEVLPTKTAQTAREHRRHLGWWKDELGSHVLADVTPGVVAAKRDELSRGKTVRQRKRSPSTVNRYLGSLSYAFTVAVREWEWLERNPLRRVRRLKEPRGRVRFLSDEERERLLTACRESEERRLYPLVVLALSTGARQGELLQLQWKDIDLARRVAVVHDTKNRERRALPIQGHAHDVVQELNQVRRLDSDLLFAAPKGRDLFPRKPWERALVAADIEDFRFHDLRHSAASYLAMNGATLAEIAEVLGHKTLAMVKRYAQLTEQHTSEVVARMNERIFGSG